MKHPPLFLFLLALSLWSCQSETSPVLKNEIVFTGNIENASKDQISIWSSLSEEDIELKDGQFTISYKAESLLEVTFVYDQNVWFSYARPGDTLNVHFDEKNFEETLGFSGKHAAENQFLLTFNNLSAEELGSYRVLFSLEEAKFFDKLDSIKTKLLAAVEDFRQEDPQADPTFLHYMEADAEYTYSTYLLKYKSNYSRFTQDTTYQESERMKVAKAAIKVEDSNLLGLMTYTRFLNTVNRNISKELMEADKELAESADKWLLSGLRAAETGFETPEVKEYMIYTLLRDQINFKGPDAVDERYNDFFESIQNPVYIEQLAKVEQKWDHLLTGMEAPGFRYPDIDSVLHSLSDYKGKYVYIDVWATWCRPCLAEQPALEEIEEYYQDNPNIVFIGLSVDENKESWEKMVREKKMKGVQIIAENAWSSKIMGQYNINEIPRFILVDTEGNLIDAIAPLPSSDAIKTQLKDLLEPEPVTGG